MILQSGRGFLGERLSVNLLLIAIQDGKGRGRWWLSWEGGGAEEWPAAWSEVLGACLLVSWGLVRAPLPSGCVHTDCIPTDVCLSVNSLASPSSTERPFRIFLLLCKSHSFLIQSLDISPEFCVWAHMPLPTEAGFSSPVSIRFCLFPSTELRKCQFGAGPIASWETAQVWEQHRPRHGKESQSS